ncbi:hypothetical protein C8F01DRAFT_1260364 [Mycena amicta]|nr:hypothetical protein C8F01DRAFT_1260364 [Mycena amicta]
MPPLPSSASPSVVQLISTFIQAALPLFCFTTLPSSPAGAPQAASTCLKLSQVLQNSPSIFVTLGLKLSPQYQSDAPSSWSLDIRFRSAVIMAHVDGRADRWRARRCGERDIESRNGPMHGEWAMGGLS